MTGMSESSSSSSLCLQSSETLLKKVVPRETPPVSNCTRKNVPGEFPFHLVSVKCYLVQSCEENLAKMFSSVQLLSSISLLWPHWLQHARLPCPSLTPGACSNSCPSSRWCHPTILSFFTLFSCLQALPASWSFPMSQFFTSGGQSIGYSASASVLPMNIQDWLPLGLTGLISLFSKVLSRVFSNTTVQKHRFFGTWHSL